MAQRSTKGASKQRRDAINERVAQIRDILPVSDAARSRLSQLQVMALARSFIAKSNLFSQAGGLMDDRQTTWSDQFDFLQAVPGFLMIIGLDGKILYISDSVCDYLGNSAVDIVTQTETLHELVDERDHAVINDALNSGSSDSGLLQTSPSSSSSLASAVHEADGVVSFVCRMNTAARSVRYAPSPIKTGFERSRTMQVRGRRLMTCDINPPFQGVMAGTGWRATTSSDCAFVAVCTPSLSAADVLSTSLLDGGAIAWDTTVFRSQHHLNMKFISVDSNGEHQLGYERGQISGKSWYEMIHPDDIREAAFKHDDLMQSPERSAWRSLCVRVQTGRGDFIWLHVVMRVCDVTSDDVTSRRVVCINQLIDENEAQVIRASALHDDISSPLDIALVHEPHRYLDGFFDNSRRLAGNKHKLVGAADCSPVKMPRQTDVLLDDTCLMSMPSPPLSDVTNLMKTCDFQTSGGTMLSADGFLKSEGPYIPDSFLSPDASPSSYTSSPPPVYHSILLPDQRFDMPVPHVEEMSFFDPAVSHGRTIKSSVLLHEDKLPELDLPTVTSYLSCLEQSEPLTLTAPLHGHLASVEYSGALPLTDAVGGGLPQKTSTIDEELLENLLFTANNFLSSVTPVKPFDCCPDLLFAHC